MSIWAEIKKSINSNLKVPLNELIEGKLIGGYELFTESGTFEVPGGVDTIWISAIGSGGAGGGSGSAYTSDASSNDGYFTLRSGTGGGGGAGYHVKDSVYPVTSGTVIPITINPGGVCEPTAIAEYGSNGFTGGVGGSIVVGSLLTLPGGNGGTGGTYSVYATNVGVNTIGVKGLGGAGGASGKDGTDGVIKGNYVSLDMGFGGAGGVNYQVFNGNFGHGGMGGNSSMAMTSNKFVNGQAGISGGSGAVLICWGHYRHDDIYGEV